MTRPAAKVAKRPRRPRPAPRRMRLWLDNITEAEIAERDLTYVTADHVQAMEAMDLIHDTLSAGEWDAFRGRLRRADNAPTPHHWETAAGRYESAERIAQVLFDELGRVLKRLAGKERATRQPARARAENGRP